MVSCPAGCKCIVEVTMCYLIHVSAHQELSHLFCNQENGMKFNLKKKNTMKNTFLMFNKVNWGLGGKTCHNAFYIVVLV